MATKESEASKKSIESVTIKEEAGDFDFGSDEDQNEEGKLNNTKSSSKGGSLNTSTKKNQNKKTDNENV